MVEDKTNEEYANFVLTYAAKRMQEGLNSLVTKLDLNEEKTSLEIELQPDLIQSFLSEFPTGNVNHLKAVVEWILLNAIKMDKNLTAEVAEETNV